jgi:hypothetical protein
MIRAAGPRAFAFIGGFILAVAGSAGAQNTPADGRWRFSVSPYLLMPYMTGTTGVGDLSVDLDANPGDIFSRLQFGAMLAAEANNGTWGVGLDGIYMDLDQDGTAGPVTGRVGLQQGVLELTGYRRVAGWAEVLLGGRVNFISAALASEGLQARSAEGDATWFDPVLGARLHAANTGKWVLMVRADIGGFGIGSDFAWQVYPRVGYRFSSLFGLDLSYRVISMDYTGSGSPGFRYDVTTFGPELGVTFHF